MNNFLKLPDNQKRDIIGQVAIRIGIPAQAVEKDLWVTTVLQMVFALPFADKLVFKGGTSLSKVWRVINRFSEDIDLAIDRELFGMSGDLTIRQIKMLRKKSSLFVKTEFCDALDEKISSLGVSAFCTAEPEPDGEGDKTYPEPRKISVKYKTLFDDIPYLLPEVTLEVGARSLFEPTAKHVVKSLLSETVPINTDVADVEITTSVPEKTFLEKAFLLHEIFTAGGSMEANRKSRHLYDLERMMDEDFAVKALADNKLWQAIQHHRELFTRVSGVDYSTDIRPFISIIPPEEVLAEWKEDYMEMQSSMIYRDSISFDSLLKRLKLLEQQLRGL